MKQRKNKERKAIEHADAVKYRIAMREDNQVFPFAGFLPGWGRFLAFVRWASCACSCCRNVFRRDFWPNNIDLGNGQRTSAACDHLFNDDSRQRNALAALGRLRVFCPPLLSGIWGGLTLTGILAGFLVPGDEHSLLQAVFVLFIGLSFSACRTTRLQCYAPIDGMKRDQQCRFAAGISGNSD